MDIDGINHLVLTVKDIDATCTFYAMVLVCSSERVKVLANMRLAKTTKCNSLTVSGSRL